MSSKLIAGIHCSEVLELLSEFLDGTLPNARAEQLRSHVTACQACEQFGADVQAALKSLRREAAPEPLSDAVSERLAKRLKEL